MYLMVLVMGVVTAMVGAVMIGFGIPINEFGIGNTLISAGTTAVVGGLVLIALAATLRQLRAVAETVQSREWPLAASEGPPLDASPFASTRLSAPGPIAAPPTSPGLAAGRETGLGPARSDYGLPRFPTRPPPTEPPDREPFDDEEETYSLPAARDREVEEEPVPFAPGRGANARGDRPRAFDAIWPAAASEPTPSPSVSHEDVSYEDVSHEEPEPRTDDHEHDAMVETAPSSILKSGVIDGMVYTLYTDGSIEAELPQGTLKFVSIDELRDYLLNKE